MKRAIIPLLVLVCFAVPGVQTDTDAQVRVRIVRSGESPQSGGDEDDANPGNVQPVEPSPEEHERIAELINELGAPTLARRDRAMSELAAYENKALTQVREGMDHDNDEIANRCAMLEEVILSEQGEYFLAARRLNLSIDKLKSLLQSDVASLLNILKARAQPGMVSLWSRILAQLSARTQVFPAAEVCIAIEGTTGFGQALARAAASGEINQSIRYMLLLLVLYPPGNPGDAVETLTQLRFSPTGDIETTLDAASELRGIYDPVAGLGARAGNPVNPDDDPEDADVVRTAMALNLVDTCSAEQLDGAGLPELEDMTPMLLQAWLDLAGRSKLLDRVGGAMDRLIASGSDARRLGIAAGAWARITPLADVFARFDDLPMAAKLSVLDTLWLYPREPRVLQPFLAGLLDHDAPGIRRAGVRGLAQMRANSTVAALMEAAREDAEVAPAALEALIPMADLLSAAQLEEISGMLPGADLHTRPQLAGVLAAAGDTAGLKPLIDEWKRALPRSELPLAFRVLSTDTAHPAGAFTAARLAHEGRTESARESFLRRQLESPDHEMVRTLLAFEVEEGFALLERMATNVDDPLRIPAMSALALADRDSGLIDDWIKRLAGEIKDPKPGDIGYAVALSTTPEAEEFRRNALQQGAESKNMVWVVHSYLAGRTAIKRDELLGVLFETPESAMRWGRYDGLLDGPLPEQAAGNIATALAFNDSNFYRDPDMVLRLEKAGVDILGVLYGQSKAPTPRDNNTIVITALLGDPERASEILDRTEEKSDGSNFIALTIARAWVDPTGDNERIARELASSPISTFGAVWRLRRASEGSATALIEVLDAFGRDSGRFQRGRTADARVVEQRWGSPRIATQGVANAGFRPDDAKGSLKSVHFAGLFQDTPPRAWGDWWSCRRALVQYDAEAGAFTFVELP